MAAVKGPVAGGMHNMGNVSADTARCETPPPPPPPKDDPIILSPGRIVDSYFSPSANRAESVYSLSRASFTHQLSQLTSLVLPDSSSLSSTVAAIPTATAATMALRNAAVQIQRWITKAEEVLGGLDADDDVEWAAAGGRDGLEDVDMAIAKFERLVQVYIQAIEELQKRPDISNVPKAESKHVLDTLDAVVSAWGNVGKLLTEVKRQVELALEWEELWNTVLGDIGSEVVQLAKLVFEMEEKRNRAKIAEEADPDLNAHVDIQELETIVEEAPAKTDRANKIDRGHRLSLLPAIPGSSPLQSPGGAELQQEDSSLLALFARLQPLRASLDFIPMRLASFRNRAQKVLPSGCTELEVRRDGLEARYQALSTDAERIRQELGEDRWVAVFRAAARQAQKMCESVERGIVKVNESLNTGGLISNPASLSKKISDFEAKKNNYGPAIQKIISVIDKGVRDRLTVNGEVLRIRTDTHNTWIKLESQIKEVDAALDELTANRQQTLRDSMSSIVSVDISTTGSAYETPISSPASSVIMTVPPHGKKGFPISPDLGAGSRASSVRSVSLTRPITSLRKASSPSTNSLSRRVSSSLYNSPTLSHLNSASPSPGGRSSPRTPTAASSGHIRNTPTPKENRPRWNSSPVVEYKDFPHTYKPLTTYSPHTKSLNGGPINPKQSIYAFRSNPTVSPGQQVSSPLARDSSANARTTYRPRARAASSLSIRPQSTGSPSSSPARSGPGSSEPQVRSRKYVPITPASAVRIPSASSGKRVSLLPLPSSLSVSFAHNDGPSNQIGPVSPSSPSMRPRLSVRPATAMADNGRTSSLHATLFPI